MPSACRYLTATPQYMICGQKVRARDRPGASKNSASGASDRLSPRVFRGQALLCEMRIVLGYRGLDAHRNRTVLLENLDPTVPHMPTSLSSVDRQTGKHPASRFSRNTKTCRGISSFFGFSSLIFTRRSVLQGIAKEQSERQCWTNFSRRAARFAAARLTPWKCKYFAISHHTHGRFYRDFRILQSTSESSGHDADDSKTFVLGRGTCWCDCQGEIER